MVGIITVALQVPTMYSHVRAHKVFSNICDGPQVGKWKFLYD